jgi:hypothetical protein
MAGDDLGLDGNDGHKTADGSTSFSEKKAAKNFWSVSRGAEPLAAQRREAEQKFLRRARGGAFFKKRFLMVLTHGGPKTAAVKAWMPDQVRHDVETTVGQG